MVPRRLLIGIRERGDVTVLKYSDMDLKIDNHLPRKKKRKKKNLKRDL